MKIAMNVFGFLLAAAGLVWALQGADILPGSFMTGDPFWLVVGTICLLVGAGLLYFANRKASAPPPQ
jgi:hypothetical protein